jgi:hypothetical protein
MADFELQRESQPPDDRQFNVIRGLCYFALTLNCLSSGGCDSLEKRYSKPNHDIPATAETRAKNRACADLLGMKENTK